jgi:hypothetical protein
MTKQDRLMAANEFIKVIAVCGRKFFEHKGFISTLEISKTGRVFFIDYYTKKRIYTHRSNCYWQGFTGGGGLKSLIESLRYYITKDKKLRAEFFQTDIGNGFENPWGYEQDIFIVRNAAVKLGIATYS